MRIALDTNVLAYAEGAGDPHRQGIALALLETMKTSGAVLPVQALGELFNVLVRKAGWSREQARQSVLAWMDAFTLAHTSAETMLSACQLAAAHQLSIWDAVMLSASAEANCQLLLSEDMHDGFVWRGVTVANPFKPELHPLLASALAD